MSTEGRAPSEQSLLSRCFVLGTRWIIANPRATIVATLLLAALAVLVSWLKLGYRTNRLDLVNRNSVHSKLWFKYIEEFGDENDAIIVVEGDQPEQVVATLDLLAEGIHRQTNLFHDVLDHIDLNKIKAKGLHYLSTTQLQQIQGFLDSLEPIISARGSWANLSLSQWLGQAREQMMAAQTPGAAATAGGTEDLARMLASLDEFLSSSGNYRSPLPEVQASVSLPPNLETRHFTAKEGRVGFIMLRLLKSDNTDNFTHNTEAEDSLRRVIAQVQQQVPDVRIGLTGLPIMENDEMRSSQSSMFWASILSMIGVALLFIAGFGGIRHALLANLILLIGMAWSFAFVTFTVGHLNILSVSFTATLIGIGIDYGIYYASRYLQLRRDGYECEPALLETSRGAGPAITTGAITTAVAFFAAGLTRFTGVAELGIIAGGGLLLCALAELVVLPAAICMVDRSGWGVRMPAPLRIDRWIRPFAMLPRLSIIATIALTLWLGQGIGKLWFDNNLLAMQAKDLESVALEQRLLKDKDLSSWYAVSVCDSREQLLARKAKFEKLPTVDHTEEIVSLIPEGLDAKRPIIDRIYRRLVALPEQVPTVPPASPEQLAQVMGGLAQLSQGMVQSPLAGQMDHLQRTLAQLPPEQLAQQLSRYQNALAEDLYRRLLALKGVANPQPPSFTDLPRSLTNRFVGKNGHHVLRIYGAGNTWNTGELDQFVREMRSVDPRVTGNPLQARESSLEMKQSYQEAALYSLLAILGVLFVDFRNFRDTLLAGLPLALGVIQSFGLMGILDIAVNPANLIALPLILGIGVDYGVHIVHEFREQKGPYRMSNGTAVAVLVDALTTIVGYGAMMIATHQGLFSLGRVLTIAVTACLINSMVVLPALLTLMTRHRAVVPSEAHAEDQTLTAEVTSTTAPPAAAPQPTGVRPRRVGTGVRAAA